jgi:hypothetical protein
MSANIDTTIQAIYDRRDGRAWHGHGEAMDAEGLALGHAIKRAFEMSPGLASAFYKASVMVQLSDGTQAPHPKAAAIVREYDQLVLPGTPGEKSFGLPQPVEHLRELVRALKGAGIDLTEPRLSYIGFLDGGRRFVASINLGDVEINGETHTRYVNLALGLDGCSSREVMYSIVRAVCMNTVAASRHDAQAFEDDRAYSSTKIRNTKNADARFKAAAIDLAEMHAEFKGLREKLERYAKVKVSEDDVADLMERVAKKAGYKTDGKRAQNRTKEWVKLYLGSGWAGTLNGLHQAFTDRDMLAGQVQTGRKDDSAEAILSSALFGTTGRFLQTAEQVLLEAADEIEARPQPATSTVSLDEVGL